MRITKGSDYLLVSPTFVGSDGETATAPQSPPTCTVTNEAGTVLTTPFVAAGNGTGVYTAALLGASHTANLDRLRVVWTGTVTGAGVQVYRDEVEVVASHWLSLGEIRHSPDLADKTKYPATLLAEVRDEYADLMDKECGVAFVRRYQRDKLFGNGRARIPLTTLRPRAILSVTISGTTADPTAFDITDAGELIYLAGVFPNSTDGSRNVIVTYEHGEEQPPRKLRREVLKCIRSECLGRRSTLPENAISQMFEGTTIRFSTPDRAAGRPTGILSLDPIILEYSKRIPGIG